jgi:DNA-binding transcriptional regulator YhcF (GntR family)
MPVERVNVRAILTAELEGAENWVYARELAARLGLNRNTVQKVLGRMVDAGVLETRMAGTVVKQWRWRQQQEEVAC